jgi:pimeloyl-ACP methyl ester carboxylesterase
MTVETTNFTRRVAVESHIPAWHGAAPQTQNLALAISEWGSPTATAENTYLLVHGLTANSQWWQTIAREMLSNSVEPLRLIALDIRGRGDSDKPSEGPYHLGAITADLIGLLEALEITEPINYIGHSLGAHVGVYFASHFPQYVRRLILIDGGARLPADVVQSISASVNRLGKLFPSFAEYLTPLKAAGIFPEWTPEIENAYRYDCGEVDGGVMSKVSKAAIDAEMANLNWFYQEVDDYYPQITAPTLVLRAPAAVAAPLSPFLTEEILDIMKTRIAGGVQIINVGTTNHYTIITYPSAEMIQKILDKAV